MMGTISAMRSTALESTRHIAAKTPPLPSASPDQLTSIFSKKHNLPTPTPAEGLKHTDYSLAGCGGGPARSNMMSRSESSVSSALPDVVSASRRSCCAPGSSLRLSRSLSLSRSRSLSLDFLERRSRRSRASASVDQSVSQVTPSPRKRSEEPIVTWSSKLRTANLLRSKG